MRHALVGGMSLVGIPNSVTGYVIAYRECRQRAAKTSVKVALEPAPRLVGGV
jgi:hypothetical protein